MKNFSYLLKSLTVFLFFIFTSTAFAQGDTCGTATQLTINGACSTSVTINGTTGLPTDCTGWTRAEYYYFTVSSGPQNITITAQSDDRNLALALYSGSCGTLSNISCVDADNTNGAQTETITANNLANGTYYIAVGNKRSSNLALTSICVTGTTPCSGTPTAGTTSVSPTSGAPSSSYTVSNTGHSTGSGITYQWQYSTNGGGAWTNQGAATSTYSNFTATAPASGTVIWRLVVTCTASGQSSNSSTATFTVNSTTNFTCATARNLPCATTNLAGTTVGSSNTAHGTACSIANYGAWYTFVGDGQLTTISSTAAFDHEMSISSGSCGSFTNIACQDSGLSGGTETYTFATTVGVNYYVYISHYSSGSTTTGTFTISRTCTAPIGNDNCSAAISVPVNPTRTCSSTVSGTIFGATDSGISGSGCGGTDNDDVWYSFVATSTTHHIELLNVAGSTTDLYHAVYSGTCGSLGSAILCSDPNTSVVSGLIPGNTYYLQIYSWGSSSGQNSTFDICISTDPPCTTPGSQATGFTTGTITSSAFPATFSGTANAYLVIRSTSATPPSQPVNGVVYTAANIGTLGSGLTLVQNGTSTSIAGTGLNGNTHYYYYIFAYNNTNCSGGPLYNTSGPLTGNATTCPASPSPITTSSTLTSVNFSWPSTLGGGANAVTYQLQVTTDAGYTSNVAGSPFTINDPTTSYNVTGLTANTTYYFRIRANNGCWSNYTTGTVTTGYCTFTSSSSTYWISNFSTTGGSTNINRNSNYTAGGYANYSATDIVTQTLGLSFNFSTTMSSGTHGINIYVDWNNDLDFNDAGEIVYASGGYVGSTTGTITIPATALIGNHRMRVVSNYFDTNPSACGSNTYTEAEDYTINVLAPAPCTGTPTTGTVTTSPNTAWPGSPYTVIATGYSLASNLTFQWQYSTTGTSGPWINAGATTSSYSNYNAIAPASGIVHWQLIVTCTTSGISTTSNTAIFTTMVISDVATGCPNVLSGGLGLNGVDPAAFNCTDASTCVDLEATYLDLGETTDYIIEPIAYNPPYSFNGLANPVSVNTDDVWSPIVNLPFDFCFYGNTYNRCLIGSNGVITFDTTSNSAGGTCSWEFDSTNPGQLPIANHSALVENAIFGVFHDIDPGEGGEVGWELITLPTGCRALIASWYDVPMYSDNSILYTGMMVLYENSNIIEVYVKEKKIDNNNVSPWNDGNAVIGIQNAAGNLATVAPGRNGLDTNWTSTNEAWRFVPNGNSIASLTWYEGSGTTGPIVGTSPVLSVCPTSTTTYTAEITYTLCDGRTIKESDETTVTVNGAKVWNGSVSTNWNVANNWTPAGVPTALDCVVIPDTTNDPIISGTNFNGLGLNLTIENAANLTVTTNNDLTITNWVNINTTGDLILQNSSSLIQINNDVNQGTMHMTRTANIRKLDYVYWSSPVTSFSLNNVSPGTTGSKYKWIPTVPSNVNGFGNWAGTSETMILGKGYIVRGPDNFTSTVSPFNAIFEGTPNNGTITTPILRGTWNGGNYSTGVSTTLGTNEDDNWNLIGNPYPSAVRAIDFLTANTNIDGFVKIWTHGTLPNSAIADPFYDSYVYNYTPGDYITYNSSGTSSGPGVFNGNIAAGQGFFVLMNHTTASTSENVSFNNTMRSSAYDNSQFFRTTNESGRIWLDLIASNGSNIRNLVAYVDGATNNRDRLFDAITDDKLSLNLYSTIGEKQMTIQGRALPFDQQDRVPMGIKVPQNGNYSIGIGILDGFFLSESQNIYLQDLENNIIHNLRENPYSFTANAGNYPNRFVLRYTNETLGGDDLTIDESNLWVYSSDVLSVKSTKNTIQSVRVFDVLGRHLAYYPNVNSYEVPLTTIQKNKAGLIIQITLSNGTIVNKKAIY